MEKYQDNTQKYNLAISDIDNRLMKLLDEDTKWHEIVNELVSELKEDDLPDNVIKAAEMLLVGFPTYKIAKELNTSSATIRRWMTRYPTLGMIVSEGSKLLSRWRMAKLEQQFLSAVERSQEVLDTELTGKTIDGEEVDPKVMTIIAAQARYIIGLFAGQKRDIRVQHELGNTVMQARKDALDYIAEQLKEQREGANEEPIEAVFKVVDPKNDDTGPFLDEDGEAPFGELGKLDVNDDGMLCHICNNRYRSLAKHVLLKHSLSTEEYETLYLLDDGIIRNTEQEHMGESE